MKKLFSFLFLMMFSALLLSAQGPKETGLRAIDQSAVKGQLEFLSSDWMEGRETGTKGEFIAGDYIASMFRVFGIQPYGEEVTERPGRMGRPPMGAMGPGSTIPRTKTYFQTIPMIEYTSGKEQFLALQTKTAGGESSVNFNYRTDFDVRAGNVGVSAEAQLVFAGYGFTDEKNGYDDYKKLDVKGKIVVILAGFPGSKDENSDAYKKFRPEGRRGQFMVERNKISRADKLGVAAIIQIGQTDDPSQSWSDNRIYPVKGQFYEGDVPLVRNENRYMLREDTLSGSIPVFTVTTRVMNAIMEGSGIDLAAFEMNAKEKMVPASQPLAGKSVSFRTTVSSRIINTRNVLGCIEGENKDEVIVIGAHYDHLGKAGGWIWNGADDNASGTVGVMTLAKAFAASGKKPEKTIVFAAWTGEEKGLLGSEYYVSKIPKDKKVILNLNYDMIARDETGDSLKNKAEMVYTEAFKELEDITTKNLKDNKINLDLSYRPSAVPGGGSDHAPFASAGIPIFYFMAAMHPDYHQPSDEISKVNWNKMTDIIRVGYLTTWEFAYRKELPQATVVPKSNPNPPAR